MLYEDWILNKYYRIGWKYHYSKFRIDPIPDTSKRCRYKCKFYAYHRRPKTTQERKYYCEFSRAKRSSRNLINAYDDKLRSDIRTRKSWKKKKIRKQWMKYKKN